MKQKAGILAALALTLFCLLPGCEKDPGESWSSSPQSEPTATSAPTPTPAPTPEASPTAEPTAVPSPAGGFEALFAENPVDKTLSEDLSTAASYSTIFAAYKNAIKNWEKVIDRLYPASFHDLGSEEAAQLEEEHTSWKASLDSELEKIEEAHSDDEDGWLAAAQEKVQHYRAHASLLCQAYYDHAGELPDLESILSGQPAG